MKKIYLAPDTVVVKVGMQQLLTSSPGDVVLNNSDTPIEDSEDIGSRRWVGVWDDEE